MDGLRGLVSILIKLFMKNDYKNLKELVWLLAKTDFKLRYQGSVLGYLWAILKPLALFAILNFVFSSLFNPKHTGSPYYSLELLSGLLMFNFFSEGTMSGLTSLVSKGNLVTKVGIPRWILVSASTLNAFLVFFANLTILAVFFIIKGFTPSFLGVVNYIWCSVLLYVLVVTFSFVAAPLFARFRDLSMIWEVCLSIIMYASPIIYPLTLMSSNIQKILLLNPVAFIIYFGKQGLIYNHFPTGVQMVLFVLVLSALLGIAIIIFNNTSRRVAEYL